MSSENEPSILEYARFYGISKNHLEVDPLGLVPPPDEPPLQLQTEPAWLQLSTSITRSPPERLVAVKAASDLLALTDPKQYKDFAFGDSDLIPTHQNRHLKVELPLLRSDHEMDMLNFVHRVEPNLAEEFIPFEKVDTEQDEGLEWPSYCHAWPEMYFQKARNEKLEMTRDVIAYIKAVLDVRLDDGMSTFQCDWPAARRDNYKVNRRQSRARDPVTPPLLPRSPSPQPFEPSSETGHLDLLSDHSSPTRAELERINRKLVEDDNLTPAKRHVEEKIVQSDELDSNSIGDIYSPLKDIHATPSPPHRKRKRLQDLKIEGPLTPPRSHKPPPWDGQQVSMSEILQSVSPGLLLPLPEPEQTSMEDIDMLFAEHIAPIAMKAERKIEQEQLQEKDTTCRVPVPVMDFSKPKAPWDYPAVDSINEGQKEFLRKMKDDHPLLPPWQLDGSVMKELSWKPFLSALGHYQLQETTEDDGSLTSFIAQPEAIDLDTLIWKPPGPRILDDGPEEEELAYGVFPPTDDVQSLIKKRNFELQNSEYVGKLPTNTKNPGQEATNVNWDSQPNKDFWKREVLQSPKLKKHDNDSKSDFSAMNALDEFLGLRTGRIKSNQKAGEKLSSAMAGETLNEPTSRQEVTAEATVLTTPTCCMPTPQLRFPTAQAFLVASTSFLSNRSLVRHIQMLYPLATIIERDFALYSLQPTYQGSDTKRTRTLPETSTDEADLILSPSTGLIFTSLPKVKQQALPGQASHSPVRERIKRVAVRFERLIVVVSRAAISPDTDSDSMGDLDESDCEALVSLTAFLKHLPTLSESELLFIDGNTSELAKWIVSLIVKYSSDQSKQLLAEETLWEVFLRQVGMNAFAAQAVLAEMKSSSERQGGIWGLRDFVLMSLEERFRRFEGILGGRKLLERAGQVLDAHWQS
ncbi:MAG: hypothetical protein Q9209_004554 [Squamulea sp. 1 TL-2023]